VWQVYLTLQLWQSTLMSESTDLRLTGRSGDGSELELVDQDGNQYNLRISDTLRANVNQPRLSAVINVDEVITTTVKEVRLDCAAEKQLIQSRAPQIGQLRRLKIMLDLFCKSVLLLSLKH